MIHHVTLETDKNKTLQELEFWQALGYARPQRTRAMGKTEWLKNVMGGDHIHLYPMTAHPANPEDPTIPSLGHVAIIPPNLLVTLVRLGKLSFDVRAEEGTEYWGARRVFVFSPSGHRVELMEYAPPAKWPAAPEDD